MTGRQDRGVPPDGTSPLEGPACVCRPESGDGLRERMAAEPATVRVLRRRVRAWLADHGIDEDTADGILLVVDEAVTNAVEHACPGSGCSVDLELGPRGCGPGVAVLVADDGTWRVPGDPGFRGRGLQMIARLAGRSTVEAGDDGTTVRMCWPGATRRGEN